VDDVLQAIYDSILEGRVTEVAAEVQRALAAGHPAGVILNQAMIAAMAEVGRRFETMEYFVPEMLVAARAMKEGLALLRPALVGAQIEPVGKVVLGTVSGDLHDIGKNLVGMVLEGAGFEVVDLGVNVPPEAFVAAVREHRPQVVGLSALLTTTMLAMKATIEALRAAGLRDQVVVMVGGAPVTPAFADRIGADLYAPEAASAAARARSRFADQGGAE